MVASDVGKTQRTGAQLELIMLDFSSVKKMLGTTVIQAYVLLPVKEETLLLGANCKMGWNNFWGIIIYFYFFLPRLSVHGIKPPNNESCFPQFTPRIFQFEQLKENKLPKKFLFSVCQLKKKIMINNYRISSYSFRGNYSFLNLSLCTATKVTVHKSAETIRGNTV